MATKKPPTTKAVQATTPLENELIKGAGLPADNAKQLLEEYGSELKEAGVMLADYKLIMVTSEDDKAGMQKAEADRKKLKKLRLAISASHKELKAPALARGNAIDYIKRRALAEIEPVEAHLLEQEKYAERKQAERVLAKVTERVNELAQYVDNTSIYNFAEMADQTYDDLLAGAKHTKALQEKAEAELKAAEAKEQARIEAVRKEIAERDRKAREEAEAEAKELRRQQLEKEAELQKERAAREALEQAEADRIAAQQKAEEVAALKQKQVAELEEQARQKAENAPDKEKLLTHVDELGTIAYPVLQTEKGEAIAIRIANHMAQNLAMYRKLINEEL